MGTMEATDPETARIALARMMVGYRDTQMLYVVPSLAICLAAASAMGLLVLIVRSLRKPPGPSL